jgi:hypothetical protein
MWREAQTSKLKAQKKLQAPNPEQAGAVPRAFGLSLEPGTWNFFKTSSFDLGARAANHRP